MDPNEKHAGRGFALAPRQAHVSPDIEFLCDERAIMW